jgi:hypothetical protein
MVSIFAWPSRSCTALRFPVLRYRWATLGQMFAMEALKQTEPRDLAITLFDAASSGVSTGGARAIEDAVAALEGFDGGYAADHPFKQSVGLPIGGFQQRPRGV